MRRLSIAACFCPCAVFGAAALAGAARGLRMCRRPPRARSTATAPRAATCWADLVPARRSRRPGTEGSLAALGLPRRLDRDQRAERRQRGRLLGAELPRQRLLVPQGLRAPRAPRTGRAGSCGSSRSTTARPSGSTASRSEATPARTCPFELEAAHLKSSGRQPARRPRRQPPRRPRRAVARGTPRRPLHRRLVELRRDPARGLPAAGQAIRLQGRPSCGPHLRCRRCDATIDVDGDGREPRRAGARRQRSRARRRGGSWRFKPAVVAGGGTRRFKAKLQARRTRGSGARTSRASTR